MGHRVRYCAFVLVVAAVAAIAPAAAQFPPAPEDQPPLAGTPKAKKKTVAPAAASATSVNGNWAGELTQVGSQSPQKIELTMTKRVLAAELGTVSETFSRTLAKFREQKLIAVKGKTITVLSPRPSEAAGSPKNSSSR